jgi:hypothetical protein
VAKAEEAEIEICCDVLLEAVESGALHVVEVEPGAYREAVSARSGKTGIAVNFCPFCGQPRPHWRAVIAGTQSEGVT